MPNGSFSTPDKRTSGAVISPLRRCDLSVAIAVSFKKLNKQVVKVDKDYFEEGEKTEEPDGNQIEVAAEKA